MSEAVLEIASRLQDAEVIELLRSRQRPKVYLMHAPEVGRVKIGVAIRVDKRMRELQVGSPVELRLVGVLDGGRELESCLHQKFAYYRVRGEWFKDSILDLIDDFLKEVERV